MVENSNMTRYLGLRLSRFQHAATNFVHAVVQFVVRSLTAGWRRAEAAWYSVAMTSLLLLIPATATVVFLIHPVAPGIAIAVLGAVAAIISLRPSARPEERAVWCLLIAILLAAEIRAIRKDRSDNARDQMEARAKQNDQFNSIGRDLKASMATNQTQFKALVDGLSTTLDGVRSTLAQTNVTMKNTLPRAIIHFDDVTGDNPYKGVLIFFGSATRTDLHYRNAGSSTATMVRIAHRMYIGEPNSLADQKRMYRQFKAEWKSFAQGPFTLRPEDHSNFCSFHQTLTESDKVGLFKRHKTIYFFSRASYRDETGTWFKDKCDGEQDPLLRGQVTQVMNPCLLEDTQKDRLRQSKMGEHVVSTR